MKKDTALNPLMLQKTLKRLRSVWRNSNQVCFEKLIAIYDGKLTSSPWPLPFQFYGRSSFLCWDLGC